MKIARGKTTWVPANEIRARDSSSSSRSRRSRAGSTVSSGSTQEFFAAHKQCEDDPGLAPPEDSFQALRYVLLHSFAHALIRQLSLECGYRRPRSGADLLSESRTDRPRWRAS